MSSEEMHLPTTNTGSPAGYPGYLKGLKERIQQARLRAALAVNSEMIMLYWQIGHEILNGQAGSDCGAPVTDMLAKDLRSAFSDYIGFSSRNLNYMKAFAQAYPDPTFVQQAVAQIPWGHMMKILDRVKDHDERCWYVEQTILNGWGQNVLAIQIESGLYRRQGKAPTNFEKTRPEPHSDLVKQLEAELETEYKSN